MVPVEHHDVKYHVYRHSRVTDINLKIGWGMSTSRAGCGQLSINR